MFCFVEPLLVFLLLFKHASALCRLRCWLALRKSSIFSAWQKRCVSSIGANCLSRRPLDNRVLLTPIVNQDDARTHRLPNILSPLRNRTRKYIWQLCSFSFSHCTHLSVRGKEDEEEESADCVQQCTCLIHIKCCRKVSWPILLFFWIIASNNASSASLFLSELYPQAKTNGRRQRRKSKTRSHLFVRSVIKDEMTRSVSNRERESKSLAPVVQAGNWRFF